MAYLQAIHEGKPLVPSTFPPFWMTSSLAARLGISRIDAQHLLDLHHQSFQRFWRWSDAAVDFALLNNHIYTVFDWRMHTTPWTNPRTLRNFPMQANGAEMLRLACCLTTERGVSVCAPIHDALLIEASLGQIDDAVTTTQDAMSEASEIVLNGFALRTDVKVIRHPDRYTDPRGTRMWQTVMELLSSEDLTPARTDGGPPSDL